MVEGELAYNEQQESLGGELKLASEFAGIGGTGVRVGPNLAARTSGIAASTTCASTTTNTNIYTRRAH